MGSVRQYYAGHRRHDASGLVYMNARWFDPGSGRFLSVDPVVSNSDNPQTFNAYSYVKNNPVNLTDPTGMCAVDSCWYTGGVVMKSGTSLSGSTASGTYYISSTDVAMAAAGLTTPGSLLGGLFFSEAGVESDGLSPGGEPGIAGSQGDAGRNPTAKVFGTNFDLDPSGVDTFLNKVSDAAADGGSVGLGELLDAGNVDRGAVGVPGKGEAGPAARGDVSIASADGQSGSISNSGTMIRVPVAGIGGLTLLSVDVGKTVSGNFQLTEAGASITKIQGLSVRVLGIPVRIRSISINADR